MGSKDVDAIVASWEHPEAFAELFERYFVVIHAYCARRGASSAEDLAGETFRIAFERRRSFDTSQSVVGPWLIGIAHNLLRNSLRSDGRSQELRLRLGQMEPPLPDPGLSAVEALEASRALDLVLAGLRAAPLDEVDALLLHVWEGLSYQEIGGALGIPSGTVGSRINRLRQRLRQQLDQSLEHDAYTQGSTRR